MSRGRHSLPEPPRSQLLLLILGLVVASLAVVAVWLVDDTWSVQAASTAVIVVVALAFVSSVRSANRASAAVWQEAVERRRELVEIQHELSELRSHHIELLLELRTLRNDLVEAAEQTARGIQVATDQRALMRDLLVPRSPAPDPVYPSMHLPLVRAAFSNQLPPKPESDAQASIQTSYPTSEDTGGSEPFPPRQLLDLTASEIARLRRAN
jgi:hypothetical protein